MGLSLHLLHNLNGAGGAVGVGGNDDGQALGLLHLLTGHVEVANASHLLVGIHLLDAGQRSGIAHQSIMSITSLTSASVTSPS